MRKAVTLGLAFFLFSLCAVTASAPLGPATEESPVVGVWIESRELGGDLTITFTADGKLKFDDGRSPVEEGSYKVNDQKDPPEIDFITPARANPADGKPPLLGIYRIEKDTLTLYLSERARPSKYEVPEGSG